MSETQAASTSTSQQEQVMANAMDAVMEAHKEPVPMGEHVHERVSMTADTPYFEAYVEQEVKDLNLLFDCLSNISTKTKTFCQRGTAMSQASKELAQACQLRRTVPDHMVSEEERKEEEDFVQKRKRVVGKEMSNLLGLLGEVRGERNSWSAANETCITCLTFLSWPSRFDRYWKKYQRLNSTCAVPWRLPWVSPWKSLWTMKPRRLPT